MSQLEFSPNRIKYHTLVDNLGPRGRICAGDSATRNKTC